MVTIDQEKCISCGACVKDCFGRNLAERNGEVKVVKPVCMFCGHCVSVCPVNAISITDYPGEDSVEITKEFPVSPENLLAAIKTRRSVRQYKSEKIDKGTIEYMLQAGRFTATGSNSRNVSYTVVQEELDTVKPLIWEGLDLLADKMLEKDPSQVYPGRWKKMYSNYLADPTNDDLFFNAPAVLIVTSESATNAVLAAATTELMANAMGLGCLFSGFILRGIQNNQKAISTLGLMDKTVQICMVLGYPNVKFKRSAPRKPLSVEWK